MDSWKVYNYIKLAASVLDIALIKHEEDALWSLSS